MKNKGFTLVELLAVFVIIAIIYLIITPIATGVIKESRLKAAENSTLGIIHAIETFYGRKMSNEGISYNPFGKMLITFDGDYNANVTVQTEDLIDETFSMFAGLYNYNADSKLSLVINGKDTNLIEYKGRKIDGGKIILDSNGVVTIVKFLEIDGFRCVNIPKVSCSEYGSMVAEEVPEDYIPIYTAYQLSKIASGVTLNIMNKDYVMLPEAKYMLMNDIDLNAFDSNGDGTGWIPISGFKGELEGKNRKIKNLTINRPGQNNQALFGVMQISATEPKSEIKNIILENVNIKANESCAGLIGVVNGKLEVNNIKTSGSITCSGSAAGLIAGAGDNSYMYGQILITKVINNINVTSTGSQASGILGSTTSTGSTPITINYSGNNGTIAGNTSAAGILVSLQSSNGIIDRVYNTGEIKGGSEIGGLIRYLAVGTISNSYNTGKIASTSRCGGAAASLGGPTAVMKNVYSSGQVGSGCGGLTSSFSSGNVTSSYWAIDASGASASGDGTGYNLSQMKNRAIYSGWDFDNIWTIVEGVSLPTLR